MFLTINKYLLLICFSMMADSCNGQMKKDKTPTSARIDRKPAVAGSFYPSNPAILIRQLNQAFELSVKKQTTGPILAIVSPHAGYVYSAKVAASAFNQIDTDKTYEHIFVIGSSHHTRFQGASIYTVGDFITPLGHIPTDALGEELVSKNTVFTNNSQPHEREHSIEVQLPFLQHVFKKEFSIVPILLGTNSPDVCRKIASALKPYFNDKNLFIISTDFSHYPPYSEARVVDAAMADAVISNNPQKLIDAVNDIENRGTPNLFTGMCGWTSVLTLIYMSSGTPEIVIRKVDYQNSGDIEQGDKSKVVGYVALSFEMPPKPNSDESFSLNEQDKATLLKLARASISAYLTSHEKPRTNIKTLTPGLEKQAGAFVSLHVNGQLRGCIGSFSANKPLYKIVQEMAISAAVNDPRFKPLTLDELETIEIEISVLTPMHKINSINEIEIGKHGIYIRKDDRTGTLLPQVATERNWTRTEFLGYCSRDKAGIGWNGWKNAEIFTYEAIIFHE